MRGYAYLLEIISKEYNAAEMILPIYTDTKSPKST
jgi:hypothetical protein